MKSGFVSILGRPNVGKSTLLNGLINHKISIVSDKAQTTRNAIKGIYNSENVQIVFVDTPGVHRPIYKLGEEMNKMAYSTAHDVDVNILVIDASKPFGEGDQFVLDHVDIKTKPLIIVLNKIDECRITEVEKLKSKYSEALPSAIFIETVATEKFNVDELRNKVIELLPEGPAYYDTNSYMDEDETFLIKEIIREKILKLLKQEVPHACAIKVNEFIDLDKKIKASADIIVERESHVGIVVGAGGKRIKTIREQSENQIKKVLKKDIDLELFVKVMQSWRDNDEVLSKLGYKNKKS